MELLALTSRVMYDRDILEKQGEIENMKKRLANLIAPKVVYEDMNEWNRLRAEAILLLRKGVEAFIPEDYSDYQWMCLYGITPTQSIEGFGALLFDVFKHISKGNGNHWGYSYAYTISNTILNTVAALVHMDLWRHVAEMGRDGMLRFFMHALLKFFTDGAAENAVDGIARIRCFACKRCAAVVYRVDKTGLCWKCAW